VHAARIGVTGIVGAGALVVTVEGSSARLASAVGTGVFQGAGVGIVTGRSICDEEATELVVTGVIGTDVFIVTDYGHSSTAIPKVAELVGCACVGIIAGQIVEQMDAASIGIAAIGGARIIIVAVEWRTRDASPVAADIAVRAGVGIVTGEFVVGVNAPGGGVAAIVGAELFIATCDGRSGEAPTVLALVSFSTGVAVVANICIGSESAAIAGVAGVIGAWITVIASQFAAADAFAEVAMVTGGANVRIVAGGLIEQVEAAALGVAAIGGANVVVIAVGESSRGTFTFLAGLSDGAFVAVITRSIAGQVLAPLIGEAGIDGAGIQVVASEGLSRDATGGNITNLKAVANVIVPAFQRRSTDAHTAATLISGGAGVAVITVGGVAALDATETRIAGVIGADIVVVANENFVPGGTRPVGAGVAKGADIAVVARKIVGHESTSTGRVAAVVCAGIVILADGRYARCAEPLLAVVANGTRVAIVAGKSFVVGYQGAGPGGGVAGCGQADGVLTRGRTRAGHNCLLVHSTLVRQ